MTYATSFFNARVLRKDITRFAPVWSLYAIFLGILTLGFLHDETAEGAANALRSFGNSMSWLSLLYALLCALVLFGDLFVPKLCYALHAMPLRREGWFLTHTVSGFLFSLVPNLVVALLSLPSLGEYWYEAFGWLLNAQLQHLFFFGLAVFCALCAGNRLATTLMYTILNFLAQLVYWMAVVLYEPLLYGISFREESFFRFSPVSHLLTLGRTCDTAYPWGYAAIIAAIGAVLLVAALVLYRRRKLEAAGDFIAFKPMALAFRVVYTLAMGMLFYTLGELFFTFSDLLFYGLLLLGVVVGYFTAQMLLRRTVKVFRVRNLFGCGILIAVLALSIFITSLDPFGLTRRVPEVENVTGVSYSGYYSGGYGDVITDPAVIADLVDLHQEILDDGVIYSTGERFSIRYALRGGLSMERHYMINESTETARRIAYYLSRPEYVLEYQDWESYLSGVAQISLGGQNVYIRSPEQIRSLLEAIRADCEAGRITMPEFYVGSSGEYVTWMEISFHRDPMDESDAYDFGIHIYDTYTETMTWLKENLTKAAYQDLLEG